MKFTLGFTFALLLQLIFFNLVFYPQVLTGLEGAYFEGQYDYSKGDIRIDTVDGHYVWKKSCWNEGMTPSFQPVDIKVED